MTNHRTFSQRALALAACSAVLAACAVPAAIAGETDAPAVGNVLAGKLPTTNSTHIIGDGDSTASNVYIQNAIAATDGDTGFDPTDGNITKIIAGDEIGGDDNGFSGWDDVYLQYDLGETRDITAVNLYHNGYDAATSTFKNVKVEISDSEDFAESTVLSDTADYVETVDTKLKPQVVAAPEGAKGRYLRVWQKGHYIENTYSSWKGYSNGCGFREIEVMAMLKDGETMPDAGEARNIALHKTPYVYGLDPTNIEAITDGEMDDDYAVHNSTGRRWLQFEYRNSYRIRRVVLKLKPGTYPSIAVSVSSTPTSAGNTIWSGTDVVVGDDPITVDIADDQAAVYGKDVRFTVDAGADRKAHYSEVEIWATGASYDETRAEYQAPASQYDQLVWSDEFNGDAVDETKWNIIDGMANHAAIYNRGAVSIVKDGEDSYLDIRTQNHGTLEALKEAVGLDDYGQTLQSKVTWSSGRLESKNKYSFQYGRMAVRAKPNDSKGVWPAIWMLAQDETGHDEIDVLEYLGQNPWGAWTTNHYGILGLNKGSHGVEHYNYEAWSQAFHVFEVEWSPEAITFFIDGSKVFTTTAGADVDGMHSRPMFPILETQIGDGWVGDVDYSGQETKQDSHFLVDWVRVYQSAGQDVTRFDDLDGTASDKASGTVSEGGETAYRIASVERTEGLVEATDGDEAWQDKNNFYYGGQPRYETSRLALAAGAEAGQSVTYRVPGVKDAHLTAYYQTLPDVSADTSAGKAGVSIRKALNAEANIDMRVETSPDGETWTAFDGVSVVDNFIEVHPGYARTTFDAYGLPEGTAYVRVVFPDIEGVTYTTGAGDEVAVQGSDVQLAKVTFQQDRASAVTPDPDPTPDPEPEPGPDQPETKPETKPEQPGDGSQGGDGGAGTTQKPNAGGATAGSHKKPGRLVTTGIAAGALAVLAIGLCAAGVGMKRLRTRR